MRNVITFKGETNLRHGVVVTKLPNIPAPMERGETIVIPGRDGVAWRGEDAYDPVQLPVEIWVRPRPDLEAVKNWLQGSGELKIADSPNVWQARVSAGGDYILCKFADGWTNTVTFECMPFRFAPDRDLQILTSPYAIYNPYPIPAQPLLRVELTGDAEIDFCGTAFELFGLTGTVWLDVELMECYTASGLNNNHMRGEFPRIPSGRSTVQWEGGVTGLTVTPRWRLR